MQVKLITGYSSKNILQNSRSAIRPYYNQCDILEINFKSSALRKASQIYEYKPSEIQGILKGIRLFEKMKPEDLYLLPGTIDFLAQRGCSRGCLQCFVKARNKISTIKWEDFSLFTEGMKELKARLGFHIFEIKREKYDIDRRDYTLSQGFYPYLDSDPIEIISLDKSGNEYHIGDFVKKFYDDMKTPIKVKTVGWDIDEINCQHSAEELTEILISDEYKDACPAVIISLHPFLKIMTRANNALNKGDEVSYELYRQQYVERMSNVLKTFLPLARRNKIIINPQFAVGAFENSGYTKSDTKKLCADVLEFLENDCKKSGIDSAFLTTEKDIEKNPFFEPLNPITSVARSKKRFLQEYTLNTYSFERGKNNARNIVVSPFDIKHAFGNEVSENIVNNINRQSDFIDNIVIDINPLVDSDIDIAEKNTLAEERSKMFMEKVLYTIGRFRVLDNLILRISYDANSKYDFEFAQSVVDEIKKHYPNINNIEFNETTREQSVKKIKKSKLAFKEIIDNLNSEGKLRFISQLRKGVDIDGQVYIPVINTRGFGEDYFENRALILDGIKFNFSDPQSYIFDSFLAQDRIFLNRDEVYKLVEEK